MPDNGLNACPIALIIIAVYGSGYYYDHNFKDEEVQVPPELVQLVVQVVSGKLKIHIQVFLVKELVYDHFSALLMSIQGNDALFI